MALKLGQHNIADNLARMYRAKYNKVCFLTPEQIIAVRVTGLPSSDEDDDASLDAMRELADFIEQ